MFAIPTAPPMQCSLTRADGKAALGWLREVRLVGSVSKERLVFLLVVCSLIETLFHEKETSTLNLAV